MTRFIFIAMLAVLSLNTGCKLIYKQNVQQGNALEQDDLEKVQLGMSKKQVAYLLGTPAIHDPFHNDRWDYISLFSRRGSDPVRRLVTLTFKNDTLVATNGIGSSQGGDIKAIEETASAVGSASSLSAVENKELVTDDAIINWTIQLGAFGNHDEAMRLLNRAKEKGYAAKEREYLVPGLGTRHQVRAGLYDTYEEAYTALENMEKNLGIAAITVPVDIPLDKNKKNGS